MTKPFMKSKMALIATMAIVPILPLWLISSTLGTGFINHLYILSTVSLSILFPVGIRLLRSTKDHFINLRPRYIAATFTNSFSLLPVAFVASVRLELLHYVLIGAIVALNYALAFVMLKTVFLKFRLIKFQEQREKC